MSEFFGGGTSVSVGLATGGKHLKVSLRQALPHVAAFLVAHIKTRTAAGLDVHDRPFKPYSKRYAAQLRRGGEKTNVDLLVTGQLLRSVHVLDKWVGDNGKQAYVIVGPDTGTSPSVVHRRWRTKSGALTTRKIKGQAKHSPGRAMRTGGRSPPHNVLGYWIQHGKGKQPRREWHGLSPQGDREMQKFLYEFGLIRLG